jgi:hypothetical protein
MKTIEANNSISTFPRLTTTLRHLFFAAIALGLIATAQAGAEIQYILTTQNDPVRPSSTLEFDLTVHNISTGPQDVRLDWTVPQFTSQAGVGGGGAAGNHVFPTLASGQSISYRFFFQILASDVVPEGELITLTLHDFTRVAMVEQTAYVRNSPAMNLALSTEQGSVKPGETFTHTLAASNISGGNLPGAELSVEIPEGATLESSDPPGQVNGNTVTWNLGTFTAGANERRNVTFRANAEGTPPPLGPVRAKLTDQSSHLAQASASTVVTVEPTFQYIVTAVYDPVQPLQVLEYDVTVHNLSTASQSLNLVWTVPFYTTEAGVGGGGAQGSHNFGPIPMGQSITYRLFFNVLADTAAPDGGNINLAIFDLDRAASVSRSVVIRVSPTLNLALSTEQASVAPGSTFN